MPNSIVSTQCNFHSHFTTNARPDLIQVQQQKQALGVKRFVNFFPYGGCPILVQSLDLRASYVVVKPSKRSKLGFNKKNPKPLTPFE